MIIIKYEKARQTVDLKTLYKEIKDHIKADIEEVADTMDGRYCVEREFVIDELLSGILEYRETQREIKEMLKVPFDVLVVVDEGSELIRV